MSLTNHYIDKITDIQNQLLPILQILENNDEKNFKKFILNNEINSLSNIMHNIDNIMLEIVKLKFACQSYCDINNRNDLSEKISIDKNLLTNDEIKEKIINDKESEELINKFIPIMMYYSMMKKSQDKISESNLNKNSNNFGPELKINKTNESEEYD